jgi:hypothetical protein
MEFDFNYSKEDNRNDFIDSVESGELDWSKFNKQPPSWLLEDEGTIIALYKTYYEWPFQTFNQILKFCSDSILNNEEICKLFVESCFYHGQLYEFGILKKPIEENIIMDDIVRRIKRIHKNNIKFFIGFGNSYAEDLIGPYFGAILELFASNETKKNKEVVLSILKFYRQSGYDFFRFQRCNWLKPYISSIDSVDEYIELVNSDWICYFFFSTEYKSNEAIQKAISIYLKEVKYVYAENLVCFEYPDYSNDEIYSMMEIYIKSKL